MYPERLQTGEKNQEFFKISRFIELSVRQGYNVNTTRIQNWFRRHSSTLNHRSTSKVGVRQKPRECNLLGQLNL
jgi:hypothetical protein